MQISNATAAQYGLLVMIAMDQWNATKPAVIPPAPDPRIKAAGWTVLGYLIGRDTTAVPSELGADVNYGFVAQWDANAADHVVVIRGTNGLLEWGEDAEFVPIAHPTLPDATVEQGFWSVYETLRLVRPDGTALEGAPDGFGRASAAIATLIRDGFAVIVGHSLGAALATYLTFDLARTESIGANASACLFASPQTGDYNFTQACDTTVADYRLFNYSLDIVPYLPHSLGYTTLPRATILRPATAEAAIRVDVACNHHVISYCAMLDYEAATSPDVTTPQDAACRACILGPETALPTLAKLLES
jgi:hypothetical protein